MVEYQNKLFPYAYNILGSAEDAKDVVQDIMVKYLSLNRKDIENMPAYLIKSVINQSINIKRKNSKLTDNTPWLPEPFATEKADSNINRTEILSYSLLVLLEKLTARERAVFILKEGFNYSHKEIAKIIKESTENSRTLLSRAKTKLSAAKRCDDTDYELGRPDYMDHYIQVIKSGDIEGLENLLSKDITLMADGGGKVQVVRELTKGRPAVRDLLCYVFQTYQKQQKTIISQVNHQPALLFYQDAALVNCQVFELEDDQIKGIYSILDPDKLRFLA